MERDSILVHLKANLAKAQHFMKKYVDTKKRLLEFFFFGQQEVA